MRVVLLAAVVWIGFAVEANAAAPCAPPAGFKDTPHPPVAAQAKLVAHTEESVINRPLQAVLDFNDRATLEDIIYKTSSLPSVSGTYPLTAGGFGAVGSRQITCLTDGSTVVEQVLEDTRKPRTYRFRYVVWNYTSEQARAIRYAVGDFLYSDVGGGRTHVKWSYAFELKGDEFPGYLGCFGQFLFRVGFLEREYADMMRGTLKRIKQGAESGPS